MSSERKSHHTLLFLVKKKTKNKIAGEGMFKSGGNKFMIISGSLHSAQKLANVLNGFWFTNKV